MGTIVINENRARGSRSGSRRHLRSGLPMRRLLWAVGFFAFHIYWYLGGSLGRSGVLPGLPDSRAAGSLRCSLRVPSRWGAWACLAIARGCPQGRMRRAVSIVV